MKIRKLCLIDKIDLSRMTEYAGFVPQSLLISKGSYLALNSFLPVNYRVFEESYVVVENGIIKGIISLERDSKYRNRWKIVRLFLDKRSSEIGKQLINYALKKFSGKGIQSFITSVNFINSEAISLFKDGCGFREAMEIMVFEKEILKISEQSLHLRKVSKKDSLILQNLDYNAILPHLRPVLMKDGEDFKDSIKKKYFVFEHPQKKSIEGYLKISKLNSKDFKADIVLPSPFEGYYSDILEFAENYVFEQKGQRLIIYLKKYYQDSKKWEEIIQKSDYKLFGNYKLLVKDCFKVIKSPVNDLVPSVLFSDNITPA